MDQDTNSLADNCNLTFFYFVHVFRAVAGPQIKPSQSSRLGYKFIAILLRATETPCHFAAMIGEIGWTRECDGSCLVPCKPSHSSGVRSSVL